MTWRVRGRGRDRVQAWLHTLSSFHDSVLVKLHDALRRAGRPGHFVSREERDCSSTWIEGQLHAGANSPVISCLGH
jgi:hypothetical protein